MSDQLFQERWSLMNLRPLSAKQNLIDSAARFRYTSRGA